MQSNKNHGQLSARFEGNLSDYCLQLEQEDKATIIGASEETAAYFAAKTYFSKVHEYTSAELEFLLRFQNPLKILVEHWPNPVDIVDGKNVFAQLGKMEDIEQRHPLVDDSESVKLVTILHGLLDENLEKNLNRLQSKISIPSLSREKLVKLSEEISNYASAHECVKEYEFTPHELKYLLGLDDPLAIFADNWPGTSSGLVPMDGAIEDVLDVLGVNDNLQAEEQGDFGLSKSDIKPSVLARLRQKEQEAKIQAPIAKPKDIKPDI